LLEIRHVDSTPELRDAYEELYEGQGILHSDSFYRWILKLIRPEPDKRFLDVACGRGRLPELAARLGVESHGLDLSTQALRGGMGKGTHLVAANGQHLPYADNTFNYLANIGSLEHYMDPYVGIREMARVLSDDGFACILLPNTYSLLANVLNAWHNGRTVDDGQPIQRFAARYEWQDILEMEGLRVIRTHKYECEFPLSWQDLLTYLQRPKAFIRLLITPFLPLNLANSFVYICKKRSGADRESRLDPAVRATPAQN
jgi:SAM-dependent methyltransferase